MFDFSYSEIIVVALVALVLFGSDKLPEAARSLGRTFNAFKSGLREAAEGKPAVEEDVTGKPGGNKR